MEKVDIINNVFKIFFINLYVCFAYMKISNFKDYTFYKILIGILSSLILALVYTALINYISAIIIFPLICFVQSIILSLITKNNMEYSIIITCISFVITYILYLILIILSGFIINLTFNIDDKRNILILLLEVFIEGIILYLIFNIRRIKNGFSFLKSSNNIKQINMYCILFLGIVLIICGLLQGSNNTFINTYMYSGTILTAISLIIWIQSQITLRYKENMKDRTIELQNEEIEKQLNKIEKIEQENLKISSVVHKYNNRLNALERAIVSELNNHANIEASSELSIMLDEVKNMSKEFSKELVTQIDIFLPKTNVMGIDNIFKHMAIKAKENNIQYDLIINHSIHYLVENIISKEELETLIGDHLNDAIIAINANNTGKRKIMCVLGKIENYYELCIYDTGINFEIETLINLGLERTTTHKEEGGSGIGFMTSFETLRKCKGSLIIEEYGLEENDYTKSITFKFDGKNEYKICSPRAEEIRLKDKEKRIIIESK